MTKIEFSDELCDKLWKEAYGGMHIRRYAELLGAEANRQLSGILCAVLSTKLPGTVFEPYCDSFEVGKRYRSKSFPDKIITAQRIVDDRVYTGEGGNYWLFGDLIPGALPEPSATVAERADDNSLVGAAGESPASEQDGVETTNDEAFMSPLVKDNNTVTFKPGDYARRRDGKIVGPLLGRASDAFPLFFYGISYKANGRQWMDEHDAAIDLIEVVPAPTEGGKSDEEVGRRLLRVYDAQPSGMKHYGPGGINAAVGSEARKLFAPDHRETERMMEALRMRNEAFEERDTALARAEAAEARLGAVREDCEAWLSAQPGGNKLVDDACNEVYEMIAHSAGFTIVPAVPAEPLKVIVK